jgi:3-oxoacyl-[acyl-carrier protein] reductase
MFTSLEGRSVVVTGASKGIGKGIAAGFARAGARVLVVGRDGDAAAAAADELGRGASAFAADVADPEACAAMAAAAIERHGGIDVLCANAGIFPTWPSPRCPRPTSTRCSARTSRAPCSR